MNEKDIVRLAEEAELWLHSDRKYEAVKKFAELVAAAEREACAKEAENRWLNKANCSAEEMYELQKKVIAEAIRARGQE